MPALTKTVLRKKFHYESRTFNISFLFIFASLFALSFNGLNKAFQNPAPGVTTELRCVEGTGATTADASGNNHDGTLVNGPVWVTGKYGRGIGLDGSNDYINIPDHSNFTLDPTQSYTWSAWVKNNNFSERSTVWSQSFGPSDFFCFYAHTSSDPVGGPVNTGVSVYWSVNNGASKLVTHSNEKVLKAGQWSYIAVTYNASQPQNNRFTIYVNGLDVTDRSDISSVGTITAIDASNIRLGSNEPFGGYLNGEIDEVRYYRRLLSLAEVKTDMTTGSNPDTQLPTATITTPATGNVSGAININVTASDNTGISGVQFLLDGVNLGPEDVSAPYSVSWNTVTTPNGNHNLTARVRDPAGNIGISPVVVVNVNNDTLLPAVVITEPLAGMVFGNISVSADATDNVAVIGVQFLLDGVNYGSEDLSAPYSAACNTSYITNGNHTLTARARDAAGNLKTSAAVVVNVFNDTELPTVNITSPAAGTISGTINVNADATDNVAIVGVQILLDSVNLGAEDLVAPYSVSWNTASATNGNHTLMAVARDVAGNIDTSAVIVVNVFNDTLLPTANITLPVAGTVSEIINVNADASDNDGVAGVQFLLNGANLGAEDLSAPYSISWNTLTSVNGPYILTARARDAAGNLGTSAPVNVTVSNINPVIAMNLNEGGGSFAADVSGNNHHGSLTNAPAWTAGKYGEGLSLDGTDDYVNIADHANFTLNPAQNYTWSGWIKNNSFTEWCTVWSQTVDVNNFFYFYAHTTNDGDGGPVTNGLSVYWWGNGGNNKLSVHSNNNVLTTGQWYYVAVTYDASQLQNNRFTIYVNGVDVTNRTDISSTGSLPSINPNNIRIGSNQPFGEYFDGSVDEIRFYKKLLTPAEVATDMNTAIGNDNIAPTVIITNPAADSIVTGTINIIANASDNVGVSGVQFLLDGVNLGPEDQIAPYSASWNSATATSGSHILTAIARDAAGNITTSVGVPVIVNADFSFTVLNPTRHVAITGSIDFGVSVAYLNGFISSNVVLSVTGLPADVTGDYLVNPMTNQGQTQLIINTNNATPGTYTLTLTAIAQGITHSQQATLIIDAPVDFTLTPSPGVQNVTAGSGISYTISIAETGGDFTSPVTLSVTGLHATMTAIFNPSSVIPDATSVLTITTTTSTPNGTYNLTVQGVSGALTHTTPITLTVNSTPPPTWPVTNLGFGWDMPIGAAFSKDGQKLFVWEKGGKLFVCNRNATTQLYDKQTTPVIDISAEVGNWDDMGLLGFALDPAFETNGLIYLLYIVDRHYLLNFGTPAYDPAPPDNVSAQKATIGRLTRYQTNNNGGIITANHATRTILIGETKSTGIPILYDSHGVGSLAFAADGTLIISAGDGANYLSVDVGSNPGSYFIDALADGIIRSEENVGAFRSQMLNSHNGKILRIDPVTGNGIPSNPYYSAAEPRSPKSRVWALGLRNPYRFTIRPGAGSANPDAGDIGEIYLGDVGWSTYEELNIIKAPGQNCGWPLFEGINYQKPVQQGDSPYWTYTTQNRDEPNPLFGIGGCNQQYFTFNNLIKQATADGSTTVNNPCNTSQPIIGGNPNRFVHRRPAIDWRQYTDSARVPIFNGNNSAIAQIGTAASGVDGTPFPGNTSIGGFWYTGNLFPANFRNTYFHADYGAKWIKTFSINYTDVVARVQDFASGFVAIVCLTENPLDGTMVYVDIGNNTVKRISYGGNQYPVVNMTSDVQYGPSALDVSFTGSNSFDPEGGNLTYLWNFGDATTSTLANPSHSFTAPAGVPKKYTVTLTVKDSVNFASTDSIIISVNNTPPVVHITNPINNSTYNIGPDSVYAFTAAVTDAEHSPSQLKYEWQKILRHNNHEHPGPIDTAKNTFAPIARIGCNGETYYYLIRLKVTDAAGLSTRDSSKIYPACQEGRIALVLRNFSVTQLGSANLVKWTTQTAFQLENFEVERSSDGINFYTIKHQQARKTAGLNEYSFSDISFPPGVNYYRLKMIEIGDVIRYSGIVKTFTEIKSEGLLISPNPAIGNFSVRYNAKDNGLAIIRITDISGRLVSTIHESVNRGQNIIYIQNLPAWRPGMYMISVQLGNDRQFGKLIKAE